jgi:hypothetical protein
MIPVNAYLRLIHFTVIVNALDIFWQISLPAGTDHPSSYPGLKEATGFLQWYRSHVVAERFVRARVNRRMKSIIAGILFMQCTPDI